MKLAVRKERRRSPDSQFSSRSYVSIHTLVNLAICKAGGEYLKTHHT